MTLPLFPLRVPAEAVEAVMAAWPRDENGERKNRGLWRDELETLLAALLSAIQPRQERALQAMREAVRCHRHETMYPWCDRCWANMVAAFHAAWNADAGREEG